MTNKDEMNSVNYEDSSFFLNDPEPYKAFAKNTNNHEILVPAVSNKVLENFSNNRLLKILDVGAGPGDFTFQLMQSLSKTLTLELSYLDPTPQYAASFRFLIKDTPFSKCVKDIVVSKWEDYTTNDKFDFILSAHSFYAVSDLREAIEKMNSLLKPGGIAVIIIEKDGIFFEVRKLFFNKATGFFSVPRNSSTVKHELNTLGINFEEKIFEHILYMENIFLSNQEANLILSFMLHKKYDEIPEKLRQEVINYLQENSNNNKGLYRNSVIWFKR